MATKFFNNLGNKIESGFNKKIVKPSDKFFKKNTQQTKRFFNKTVDNAEKFFGKGSQGSKLLGQISKELEKGADVLDVVHKYGNAVLNNPATKAFIATQPELQPFYGALVSANAGIKATAVAGHGLSAITRQKNYTNKGVNNILEKSVANKNLRNTVNFA